MRSHSGRDKARNNMRHPTLRERQSEQTKVWMSGRTAEMGSRARKTGRKGSGGHR